MAAASDDSLKRQLLCVGCSRRGAAVFRDLIASGSRHHTLRCGHTFCELCLSVTRKSNIIVCLDCEDITTVNTNQGFYGVDDCVEEHYTRKWLSTKRQSLQTSQDNLTRSNRGNSYVCHMMKEYISSEESQENHVGHKEGDEDCDRSPKDNKTVQDIDEALWIAAFNLERLKTAEKMLGYLESQVKREEVRIAEIMDKKFDNLIASLQSRKRKLHAELVKNTDNYVANIMHVKQYIEEKRNYLNGTMRLAKELKITPSLRTCCDMNQVIQNLKLTVEDELSRVDTLKERTSLRFLMNCDEIISMFKNMGKIELETKYCPGGDGQCILMVKNQGEVSDSNTYLSVDTNKCTTLVRDNEAETLILQEFDVHPEVKNFQLYKLITTPSQKSILTLPQMMSGPDVIIEEIMEDDQETHSTEYLKDTHRKKLSQKKSIPFGQRPGAPELVFVSHVINPCHFYIRRYSQKKTAIFLGKKLSHFCSSKSSYLNPSDVLELGARIFINSKENGMWCRGTITELIPLESKNKEKVCGPTKYRIYDVAVMQVFMVDFGNSEVLVVSGIGGVPVVRPPEQAALQNLVVNDLCVFIRKPDPRIEAQLRDIPPLAVQCSLKDIVPKNSNEGWGEEIKTEFLRMVNNKAVIMKVFREEDGVLIVDLKKPPVNKIRSDMPVSLKDALVFTELARFRSQLPSQLENNMALQYCPPTLPQEMTEVSVVVCHINSPSDFYLQLIDSLDFLVLLKKIEEVYKNDDGENLEILCPVQGQACIAKFEDGVWYRAQVTGLPGHQEVEVKYVDFGNTAKITLKDMRKVKDEFLSPPEKAIRSKLAHIEPCKGTNEWSRQAKERFEQMIQDKFMLCSVISISQDNVLSVELFDCPADLGKSSSSVNSQLVKEELASYELGYIQSSATEHNEIWEPSLEEVFETETLDILNSENIKSLQDEDLQSFSNKELQVRVSHVVSPNKIFVQWLSSESLLKSLQENMAVVYENSKFEQVKWESDMYCAVRICDRKQWQRGKISKVVSETTVEVMLYDFGAKEIVNITCLRKLDEKLKPIRTLALECSLVDIRPAGGSNQWTATACDCISYYLTGTVANLIIQENDGYQPLPVKIFCNDESGQLIDISEYLMKRGLAFRNKRIHEIDLSDADPEKPLEVPLKQESPCLNELILETDCTTKCLVPEKEATLSINEPKEYESKKLVLKSIMENGTYKPPIIPDRKDFLAVISCIRDDGTIYMIPKSFESELNKLMADMQNNVKCLGLLEPYCWKKDEACIVRGSDTMWYRGKVIEVGGGTIRVQYMDYGYVEKIPQCHLYPAVLYADIPTFCIPCQVYKIVPIGNFWQPDAVELLQELLTKRVVEVHLLERPCNPWGKVSVNLYFDGMSLASFMAYHQHCIFEGCQDISDMEVINNNEKCVEDYCEISCEELLLSEARAFLPPYSMLTLPIPGELFPVTVKHLVSPNEMYICLESAENLNQQSDTEDSGVSWDLEFGSLDEDLRHCNQNVTSLPFLTEFIIEMPCLAEYSDGLWYRAKLLCIKDFDPVNVLVQFVDYGSTEKLPTSRLRQIPSHLMQYPAQAIRVLLAGFKPPLCDTEKKRIPYCPEWSMQALWTMIDCLQGKELYASMVTHSPEYTVHLYEDEQCLVHMKLVEMGLADLDQ